MLTHEELEVLQYDFIRRQRSEPATAEAINTRAAMFVPSSIDEDERSVRSCLTTEDAVPVYDWMTGKVVLETLLVSGCEYEDQTVLLRDHDQYTILAIIGSVTEVAAEADELIGTLHFGRELDEDSEAIWRRVEQGHLKRGSIGYDYSRGDYVTIPAGETSTVAGRSFTAPQSRDLRVVFRWRLREYSMVVIPADARAQMRQLRNPSGDGDGVQRGTPVGGGKTLSDPPTGTRTTPPPRETTVNELINFLRQHGLAEETAIADTAAAFAWARDNLGRGHYQALRDLCRTHSIEGFTADDFPVTRSSPNPLTPPVDLAAAVRDERERQSAIRSLHAEYPTVSTEIVNRCLNDGLSIDATRSAFLEAYRGGRTEPVAPVPTRAPAAHVRGGLTLAILQAGLLARNGITPDSACLRAPVAEQVFTRDELGAGWLRGAARTGEQRDLVEAAFDEASNRRLAAGSFMRFCEGLNEIQDGYRSSFAEDEIMERAFSNGDFSKLFGPVVHIMMVEGYTETPATYEEFCRLKDVPDFRPNQEGMVNGVGRLKKQGKNGGQAALLNIEDPTVSQVAAERYAGMLKVSDQVIINDSFDVLESLPREVGISARQVPSDLAYALLLGNPNLSDGQPLYRTGVNLIANGTLDETGLTAASTMLKNQKIGGKRIVVSQSVLLHGTTLSQAAKKVIDSEYDADGQVNTQQGGYRRVEDNAIDLGVNNPADEDKPVAPKPGRYFLFGEPKRSFVMAFRRGTNRGPVSRRGRLPVGEFGDCWDVYIDCGVAPTSRTGTVAVDV